MSIAANELWSRIIRSGLTDQQGCNRFADTFARKVGGKSDDTAAIVSFLVREGLLTKYQARQLVADSPPALRLGAFVIKDDAPVRPFLHWIPVQTTVDHSSPQARHGFLLRVPLSGLDEARRSWLAVHSAIQAPTLQSVELSGGAQADGDEQIVEIFSPMPTGASLWSVIESKPKLSSRKTIRLGIDVAEALVAMHSAASGALPHGAIGADHIWVTPKGNAVLLRDPSSPARSPRGDLSSSWIEQIESPALHAAPELADPHAAPTVASDIYSLGCLLFSLIQGRPAFNEESDSDLFAAHNETLPAELEEAVSLGANGDPLLRVLAYAMAKDPAARFASAASFAQALQRAGEVIETESQPIPAANESSETVRPVEPQPIPAEPKTPTSAASTSKPTPNVDTRAEKISTEPSTPSVVEEKVVGDEPGIEARPSTETSAVRRKRRRRNKNRIPILAGLMVVPVLLLGLAIVLRGRGPQKRSPGPRPSPSITENIPKVGTARRDIPEVDGPTMVRGYEIVDNDRLLWVPPYESESKPPSLELLPPGPAIIVKLAVAEIRNDNSPIRKTFATEIDALFEMVSRRVGVPAESIQECTIGLFPGKNGVPETAFVIRLAEAAKLESLLDQWGAVQTRSGDAVLYTDEDLVSAFYIGGGDNGKLPDGTDVTRFAVGSLDQIREVAANGGGSIPLVRSMQSLWNRASDQMDVVVLATPNFLFADGRQMLAESVPEFRQPLKRLLIPDVAAFLFSLDLGDAALYAELREIPSGGATQVTLLEDLRTSMQAWPDWADQFLLGAVPDRSWRLLASRLPLMLRFVADQTRSTIDGQTVVASTYLPPDAAAQVSLATVLAMNTPQDESVATDSANVVALSVEEQLNRPMSISFLQLSLQFSIDAVADEFNQDLPKGSAVPKFRIIGGDLELNGITQNQQIRGLEKENVPLRNVLTDIVLAANPDPTSTGPKDPKQALVWVVHPVGKPPEETEILITTRDAAKKKNYVLPDEFQINR